MSTWWWRRLNTKSPVVVRPVKTLTATGTMHPTPFLSRSISGEDCHSWSIHSKIQRHCTTRTTPCGLMPSDTTSRKDPPNKNGRKQLSFMLPTLIYTGKSDSYFFFSVISFICTYILFTKPIYYQKKFILCSSSNRRALLDDDVPVF